MTPSTPLLGGRGTPERVWERWPALHALPELDLRECRSALLVAPHPDDETLGVGGLTVQLLAAGAGVVLLSATDGELSHPHSPSTSPVQMAHRRRQEGDAALRTLSADLPGRVEHVRLHLPDGGLRAAERALTAAVARLATPGTWVFAPWEADGHPDHEAAWAASSRACDDVGAPLYGYPVWTWTWATPGDPRVPWHRAVRLPLPVEARRRKAAALACFPSQTAPLGPGPEDEAVLCPEVLAHFRRDAELFFR